MRSALQVISSVERVLAHSSCVFGQGSRWPEEEARWLTAKITGLDPNDLIDPHVSEKIFVSEQQYQEINEILRRRVYEKTPMAYLLKEAKLGGLTFYVDNRVIIPRSFISELDLDKKIEKCDKVIQNVACMWFRILMFRPSFWIFVQVVGCSPFSQRQNGFLLVVA